MSRPSEVELVGARVEELLDQLRIDSTAAGKVEELVRLLLELYGNALGRVMSLAGDDLGRRMATDRFLSNLLVLHDLHPDPPPIRIERALQEIRPILGSHAGGVELRGMDEDGTVHLRLEGTCHHCPSSAVTVQGVIEEAVLSAAPEAMAVEVEGLLEQGSEPAFIPLESLGRRCPSELTDAR